MLSFERPPVPPPESPERIPTTVYKDLARLGNAVVPMTVTIPNELIDPHPLLVVHGYMGKPFAYDDLCDAAGQRGRAVVDVSPPRHEGMASLNPRNLIETIVDPMRLLSKSLWAVTKKLRADYDDKLDPSKEDVAGHSMGFPVAVRFAEEKPGVVRTLINIEGAGCEDHHTTFDFVPTRVRQFTEEEAIPFLGALARGEHTFERGLPHAARSQAHYVFAHPLRTVAEGVHVSNSYVVDAVKHIKRTQDVAVVAVLGESDRLIPPERTVSHAWGIFDEGEIVDCGHLLPQREPELAADIIVDLADKVT